jgi:hypothetical protein
VTTTKTGEQSDKDGMTLDEIGAFVQDAMRLGIPGDARVTAIIKLGSARVKKIEVKG